MGILTFADIVEETNFSTHYAYNNYSNPRDTFLSGNTHL
jgi:hypothetical protein